MFRTLLAFTLGVYFVQEFPTVLPNVKNEGLILYNQILKSQFYKKIREDYNKKNF